MSDLGEAYLYLDQNLLEIDLGLLILFQRSYIDQIVKRFVMQDGSPAVAPIIKGDNILFLKSKTKIEEDSMKDIACAYTIWRFNLFTSLQSS